MMEQAIHRETFVLTPVSYRLAYAWSMRVLLGPVEKVFPSTYTNSFIILEPNLKRCRYLYSAVSTCDLEH